MILYRLNLKDNSLTRKFPLEDQVCQVSGKNVADKFPEVGTTTSKEGSVLTSQLLCFKNLQL